jgi:hypothetical protein
MVISECSSVTHPSAPITDRIVRLSISRTRWEVAPEPHGRTRLSLRLVLPASAAVGVPKFVVNWCQTKSLRESVTSLLDTVERLQLPADPVYMGWGRTRAEAALARGANSRADAPHPFTATSCLVLVWRLSCSLWGQLSFAVAAAVLIAHMLVNSGSVGLLCALRSRAAGPRLCAGAAMAVGECEGEHEPAPAGHTAAAAA